MGLQSQLFFVLSIVLIGHSGFSSYEFHQLLKKSTTDTTPELPVQIPKDIVYEAIVGLIVFILSSFLSFEKLTYFPLVGPKKLLTQGQYLQDIEMSKATNVDNLIGSDPAGAVNYTPNFVDIMEKRSQVKDWEAKKDI